MREFRDFPSALIIQLSGHMAEAAEDLLDNDDGLLLDLHARFVVWAQPPCTADPEI